MIDNKRVVARRTLLAATLMLANSAFAADSSDRSDGRMENVAVIGEQLDSYLVGEMDTATGLGLSGLDTPQSVSAISRGQMDDFGLNNLNDALQSTTGVQVESVETDRTYYTARGFDITNFQVDGVGLPAAYGNTNGVIDTAIYDRIEVVRGASGLMSGAGNPSATINMVRKRPSDDFQLSLGAGAGSWNNRRLDADVSGTITEGLRGRFVVAEDRGDSYLDNYGKDTTVAYGVVDRDLGESTRLTVGASYQSSKADSPMWGALPLTYSDGTPTDYDVSASTAADWAFWDTREKAVFAELKHSFANGWEAKAYYTRTDTDEDSQLLYMYSLPVQGTETGLVGLPSAYSLDGSEELLDLRISGNYQLFGREHELMFGANRAESSIDELSLYAAEYTYPNVLNVGDFSQWNGTAVARPVFDDGATGSDWGDTQTALYAATRFHLSDALSLVGGARMVNWKGEGAAYGESQATEANGKVLPYAGLVYRFGDSYSLYASHTETFMPQRDLDKNLQRLAPSAGSNDELGVKGAFADGKLNASLAVFQADYTNVSESAGFDASIGKTVYQGHDYETRGYELELTGELAPGLQASVGYTALDIEENGDEARTFVPKNVVRVLASYRLPMLEQLKVGAGLNWQDDIARVDGYGNRIEQDAYATVRAFANYRVGDKLDFSLNVNNLTDEKFISSLYWDQGFYAAPRNFSASVNWHY
ncbi:TonB-dependent siderophore receptor [Microbulbifer sp. SAOS-129_SWC]|uniref:TonB-dependent siderophore receptor n=1 Tax=Microbulbifer sp. SAOS-129_SWC TaxID=3145235 RepID=UPI0032168693